MSTGAKEVIIAYLPEPNEGRRAIPTFIVDSINKKDVTELLLRKPLGIWGTKLEKEDISLETVLDDKSLKALMEHWKLNILSFEEFKEKISKLKTDH